MDNARPIFGIRTRPSFVTYDHPRGVTLVPTNFNIEGDTSSQSPKNAGFRHSFAQLDQVG